MKQDSEYYEHFYGDLEPYVHYWPLKHDLSDLLEIVRWAKKNDATVSFNVTGLINMAIRIDETLFI